MPCTIPAPIISDQIIDMVIASLTDNLPEASDGMAVQCEAFDYDERKFTMFDDEEGKRHVVTKDMLIKAFPLLLSPEWPAGLTQPPRSSELKDWDAWLDQTDGADVDGFIQLAIFGKVIYG